MRFDFDVLGCTIARRSNEHEDDVEEMPRTIVGFEVRVLAVPDPHPHCQAPERQVFRLIGSRENRSIYDSTG